MQACPYDALYIDPDEHTAQKCNYCVHRVEVGLQPACVVVCPEQAITAGDVDDSLSKIAKLIAEQDLSQRALERGTNPNVWYKGAESANLEPLAATRSDDGGIWRDPKDIEKSWLDVDLSGGSDGGKAPSRRVEDDAGHARVVYANDFPMPWGWRVSSYFLTKAISAGVAIAALMALLFGAVIESTWMLLGAPLVGGVFLMLTGVLLVWDLKRPDRFLYLLTKGNPSSWLVRGAWVLTAQAAAFGVWFLAAVADLDGIVIVSIWVAAFIGLATAGYTALLFGQAKGRSLWNSPLLVWHMIAAAFAVGGGASLLVSLASETDRVSGSSASLAAGDVSVGAAAFAWTMLIGAIGLGAIAIAEARTTHGSDAELAYHHMTRGAFSGGYWIGVALSVAIAATASAAVLLGGLVEVGALGGVAAMVGVWLVDDAFVRAGQSVPLT
jgi:hypothetical protein